MTGKSKQSLEMKAQEGFRKLGLLTDKLSLLLMVSGGSDSLALLRLTQKMCAPDTTLQVLHINHQLRGAEAKADESFVVDVCKALDVPCKVAQFDVAGIAAQTKEGTEQAGRRLRYQEAEETLASLCSLHNQNQGFILTAHTADDRAETLLQRLIVGGGGSSLSSIPWSNGSVVRPLLDCTRQELRDWLLTQDKLGLEHFWREDATNEDTYYSRAFVRHEVLPLLATRNPRIVESLNRTADVLSTESAWLDEQASELLPLSKTSFDAPLPLLRRAVYLACNKAIAELAPGARITYDHVDLICTEGNTEGFACQIPGGIELRHKKGVLVFSKAKPPQHDPRTSSK